MAYAIVTRLDELMFVQVKSPGSPLPGPPSQTTRLRTPAAGGVDGFTDATSNDGCASAGWL
ncbi:MAG: hypothetical protein ACLQU1_06660 [Bryobacteraceae bacterium]